MEVMPGKLVVQLLLLFITTFILVRVLKLKNRCLWEKIFYKL